MSDVTAIGTMKKRKRCQMGCIWTEGVLFGGHSRDVEAVSEPLRSKWGASDPAGRNGSTAPTDILYCTHRQP